MSKIYQFPQGKEKQKLKREFAKIKRAPIHHKRKMLAMKVTGKLFYGIRFILAGFADLSLLLAVTVCRGIIYLSVILGSFFLLLKYHTNGGVWDGSMCFCVAMIVLGLLDPNDVSEWHLFQRLFGVYHSRQKSKQHEQENEAD
ncbi:hypothetical protein LF283_004891 [Salmonella enterica]|nr:hypothetical protein [Salmonella enterica]